MTDIPQTRASLLISLRQRSEDAWAEFLDIYEKAVLRFCFSKGLQEADSHDVLQEVLAAVVKKLPSWDHRPEKGKFRGWLFTVARNIAVDVIDRKAKNRAVASGQSTVAKMLSQFPESSTEEVSFDIEYQRELFDWASCQVKSEVKDVTWQAFHKTAVGGHQAATVAEQLGIPVGSVYTAKCRVVSRIRKKIAELGDEVDFDFNSPASRRQGETHDQS